jgi:hypothetical protein
LLGGKLVKPTKACRLGKTAIIKKIDQDRRLCW